MTADNEIHCAYLCTCGNEWRDSISGSALDIPNVIFWKYKD
ncbi:MAG: hypothetical protein AB7V16_07255 [Vulcanibacillus sp.]